ncbi:hypothetical protein ACFY03_23070 [Micromonospora chersina]|uniref:hypothetical protein n=1 Tax=Micromonospora chersina TaxID=47854 RepID=UPI0036B9237D
MYAQQVRAEFLSAPVVAPPEPWRYLDQTPRYSPAGGLTGLGFGVQPQTGVDLLMAVSSRHCGASP